MKLWLLELNKKRENHLEQLKELHKKQMEELQKLKLKNDQLQKKMEWLENIIDAVACY